MQYISISNNMCIHINTHTHIQIYNKYTNIMRFKVGLRPKRCAAKVGGFRNRSVHAKTLYHKCIFFKITTSALH